MRPGQSPPSSQTSWLHPALGPEGLRPWRADPRQAVSFGLFWPQPTQKEGPSCTAEGPRHIADPCPQCRHRQSPGPGTPQHWPANFYSLRSRLHLGFLWEAFPDLPRTEKCASSVLPQHTTSGLATCLNLRPHPLLPTPKGSSPRKKASSFLITFRSPALIAMCGTKGELQSISHANLKIR